MPVPTFDELINPTLRALRELGGSASIQELAESVIGGLQLSEEDAQQPHGRGPQTEVEYRIAWARTYLKKFGLITNSERGVWSLTPEGARIGEVDPQEVVRFVRQQRNGQTRRAAGDRRRAQEEIAEADEETAPWREHLLAVLLAMDPSAFERLCKRLLRESGFIEVEVTGRSGDGGIDGHGIIRVAGLISFTVLFQCKRYRDNIGPSVVRDFRGAMIGRSDKGLLITTAGFTREARMEATRDGAPPIDLISGDLLVEKLKELKLGVRTRMVEVVEVDAGWFNEI